MANTTDWSRLLLDPAQGIGDPRRYLPLLSGGDTGQRDKYERAWDNLGVGQVGQTQPLDTSPWERFGGDVPLMYNQQAQPQNPLAAAASAGAQSAQQAVNGAATGANFGYSYRNPGGGWNPVSLLDARDGYDGTAVDGYYNARADKGTSWGAGEPAELDRARVWRWTMDQLKGDFSNPELVKQTFLQNVARLRRDYEAPENRARGLNWANSAFSGYDRFLQGGGQPGAPAQTGSNQGGRQGTPPPTGPQGNPVAAAAAAAAQAGSNAAQQAATGGSGVNPPMGQGLVAGAQAAAGGQGDPLNYNVQLQKDKASRVNALLQALGLGSPSAQHSRVGGVLSNFYSGIMDPYLSARGLAAGGRPGEMPMDNLGGMISDLARLGNQAGGFGQIRDVAQGGINAMLGQDMSSLDESDVQNIVSQFSALRNSGLAPILQQLYGNQLDDSMGQLVNYQDQGLKAGNTAQATTRWLDYLKNAPNSGVYNFLTGR